MKSGRSAVIVISSLVARGSVGARASQFVLERLGFPVWLVPTVTLAWHPAHSRSTRITPEPAAFAALADDLARSPHLAEVGAVLAGYFGHADQVDAAAALIAAVRLANPAATVLCDPIIGDDYGLFQPPVIAGAIRDRLLPLADIATPNRYELAWLTGADIADERDLVAAARRLGPREVVVTSAFAPDGQVGNAVVLGDAVHHADHRFEPAVPHGPGDFLAALYLGLRLDGAAPAAALGRSAAATMRMIAMAVEHRTDEMPLAAGQEFIARA